MKKKKVKKIMPKKSIFIFMFMIIIQNMKVKN